MENDEDTDDDDKKKWTVCEVLQSRELWLPISLSCSVNLASQITVMDEVLFFSENLLTSWALDENIVQWSFMAVAVINAVVAALAV